MKKLNLVFLFVLLSFGHKAKAYYLNKDNVVTRPVSHQEDRTIGNFKGVATGGSLEVKITMGNRESIRLEGDKDAIAELITEVNEGILTIHPKAKWSDWSRRYKRPEITVYITAKRISSLTMTGSGHMEVQNNINANELVTTLSGSGSIKATVIAKSVTGVISGSGGVTLSGRANNSSLTISGSGGFDGKRFSIESLSAQISGSANVYIDVSKSIDAVISGSGTISYSGSPSIKKTIIGSGSIRKR
jgi:hypothetical protein